jgi:hypothetical protein
MLVEDLENLQALAAVRIQRDLVSLGLCVVPVAGLGVSIPVGSDVDEDDLRAFLERFGGRFMTSDAVGSGGVVDGNLFKWKG